MGQKKYNIKNIIRVFIFILVLVQPKQYSLVLHAYVSSKIMK